MKTARSRRRGDQRSPARTEHASPASAGDKPSHLSPDGESLRRETAESGRSLSAPTALKTRTWILLLAAVFLALAGIVAWQYFGARPAGTAEVWADGELVRTLDLSEDGEYRVETDRGWNLLTVSDGRVAVTAASCPDADCVRCGPQNSGPPIVCLPNRVSIQFSDPGTVDGVVR